MTNENKDSKILRVEEKQALINFIESTKITLLFKKKQA